MDYVAKWSCMCFLWLLFGEGGGVQELGIGVAGGLF